MPSRSSFLTAECSARSVVMVPVFTRVMASTEAERKACLAPSTIWMLSRAKILATPSTVAVTC